MKDKIKGALIGLLIGVLISSSVIYASSGTVTKDLLYRNIKITLDGEEIIPRDVNGKYVEPFIIDGTTYLPVRAISSALGLEVDWIDNTSTVVLSSNNANTTCNDIIFDSKSIVITYLGYEFDSNNNLNVLLFIENNSNQPIMVQTRDQSINGLMIEPIFSEKIQSGKKANATIEFPSRYLEKNNIKRIEEIEFCFYICHKETWDTIAKSDPITIRSDGVKNSASTNTDITSSDLSLLLEFINLGVESHSACLQNLTSYVKTGNKSYTSMFYENLRVGLEAFENAYEISSKSSSLSSTSDYLSACINIYKTIQNGSYTVAELGELLEPANEYFTEILKEIKEYSDY